MNHTKTLTLILLTLLTAASGMATAQNRTEKRPRKLSTKKQLVIERQRADSLAALVEEYRRRESDWQKAWHDAQEQDERHHHVEQFARMTTPPPAPTLWPSSCDCSRWTTPCRTSSTTTYASLRT